MKNLIILCTVILIVLLPGALLFGCQQEPELSISPPPQRPAVESLAYTNSEYGFSVEYPKDWGILEDYMGTVVAFMGPLVLEETYYVNINVITEQLLEDMMLKDYVKAVELNTKRAFIDYEKVSEYSTTLDGLPATVLISTCTIQEEGTKYALKDSIAICINDNVGYIITYDVPVELYDPYTDCFDLVVSTLKFE